MQGAMASVLDLRKYHVLHPLSDEAKEDMHADIEQLVEEQRAMGDGSWQLTVISSAGPLNMGSRAALDAYCACVRREDRPLNAQCIELTFTETPESQTANGFMEHDVYQFASLFQSAVPDIFPVLETLSFRYACMITYRMKAGPPACGVLSTSCKQLLLAGGRELATRL